MKYFRNFIFLLSVLLMYGCGNNTHPPQKRPYLGKYEGAYLNMVSFPVGGIGAGMFCIEGTGAISGMSVHHIPDLFNEPNMFAAIHIKGKENGSKVLEGPVPDRKIYGAKDLGGGAFTTWGLPRFENVTFNSRFPFADIELADRDISLGVEMKVWTPFIPSDEDNSGLPVGGFEYTFKNTTSEDIEAIFSYHSENFMRKHVEAPAGIRSIKNGFVLEQKAPEGEEHHYGEFAIFTNDDHTQVNHYWFRTGWWDPLTIAWKNISEGTIVSNNPVDGDVPGASLFVPFKVKPGESKTIRLHMVWYVPKSNINAGQDAENNSDKGVKNPFTYGDNSIPKYYEPWYGKRFKSLDEVASYWLNNYDDLRDKTERFTHAFYSSTLPPEVLEAVSANMSILLTPTVLRQHDGRMWCWEGCGDKEGSCHGSCTHVWNYAQAVPHLFPALERSLRETEFFVNQNLEGYQMFRATLPIRPVKHDFYAAADGQLGGMTKIYRDWRISGDTEWLRTMFPQVKQSLDYCIATWDPHKVGALEEPHHNTYDIEFWGANGMCTSFYASALQSIVLMGKALNENVAEYETLLAKSKDYMENKLYNGEYFVQNVRWEGLHASNPVEIAKEELGKNETPELQELIIKEGPRYQYGKGCLADGVIGGWMSLTAGMKGPVDDEKIKSHLNAVHKYNLKRNLSDHINPQRGTYAIGQEGGLLMCTWPKGGRPILPFGFSDEIWTGVEYQVAAHLIFMGEVEKGLEIVRICRDRYNGKVRNPYNEIECGGFYARALSSYSLLQALTGVRYDAVDRTLYIDSRIGDNFTTFLSTNKGFGTVGLKNGKPVITVYYGNIDIQKCIVSGVEADFEDTAPLFAQL